MTEAKKPRKKAAPKAAAKSAPAATRAKRRSAAPPEAKGPLASGPVTGVHDLRPNAGATRGRKRVGRGPGSGHGKTAGRGHKGQKSRTGYSHMRGFEGGQMPLHRRVPKRGFTNVFRVEYAPVNLSALAGFGKGEEVTPDSLHAKGITARGGRIKILGDGEVKAALVVRAHKFSASAKAKIEQAGGRCEVIETPKTRAER